MFFHYCFKIKLGLAFDISILKPAAIKTIVKYLIDYYQSNFNAKVYIYTALLLLVTITINYQLDYEDTILDSGFGSVMGFFYYYLNFAFAYFACLIPIYFLKNKQLDGEGLTRGFWIKAILFLCCLAFAKGFYWSYAWIFTYLKGSQAFFVARIVNNLTKPLLFGVLLLLIKMLYDRQTRGLYGLTNASFDYKSYLVMLLIMIPLITWASFQPAFQRTYPMFKPWTINEVFGLNNVQMSIIYELIYGFNFFSVELFFRGALIIGLHKYLGKDAVLPMVVCYAFFHFGKPMAETIGSIAGGYILGIISFYSRNILGGCMLHIGVAWLMDAMAYLQYWYRLFQ